MSLLSRSYLFLIGFVISVSSALAQIEAELPCPEKIRDPILDTQSNGHIGFMATFPTRTVKGKNQKGKRVSVAFCKTVFVDLSEIARIGREGTEPARSAQKISFQRYRQLSDSLRSIHKPFLDAYTRSCGDRRKPSEQIADEIDIESSSPITNSSKWMALLRAEALEQTVVRQDATRTDGVQQRQLARIMTPEIAKSMRFCNNVEMLRLDLFGKNRLFDRSATLEQFTKRYDIDSCGNSDYRDLVARVKSFEICPECQQRRQDATLPACMTQKNFDPVLEKISGQKTSIRSKIEFARAASAALVQMIEEQMPIFRQVLTQARADLKQFEAHLSSMRDAMLKAPKSEPLMKSDVLRPPTPDQIIQQIRLHDGRRYDDLIKSREELLERAKGPLADLKKPIIDDSDANDRLSYLMRYSPQIVDSLFRRLETFATCDVSKRRALDRLKVALCESYNSAQSRRNTEKWIVDALGMFSTGAYTGGMVFAAHGNVPGAAISGGLGLASSVGGDVAKGIFETTLYSNRAVVSAAFGETDAAAHFLSLRDQAENEAWVSVGTDVVMGAAYFYSTANVIKTLGKAATEAQALRFEKGAEYLAQRQPSLVPTLKNVGTNLSPEQARAIEAAHQVGMKSELAGTPFSKAELREKARILEKAGFNSEERAALMRSGVTGMESRVSASVANPVVNSGYRDVQTTKNAEKNLRELERSNRQIAKKYTEWKTAVEKDGLNETRKIPGYHDEPLSGRLKNCRSVRLSSGYRAIYRLTKTGSLEVLMVTNHDYNNINPDWCL